MADLARRKKREATSTPFFIQSGAESIENACSKDEEEEEQRRKTA